MLFSILIPTYNNEKTIRKAIESCLNQDYKDDYEIIVTNNASTDHTLEIIKSYQDPKLKVFTNNQNIGLFANHNRALELASGDYVLFCHSDDQLQPFALTLIAERLKIRHFPYKYIMCGHSMHNDFSRTLIESKIPFNCCFSGFLAIRTFLRFGGLTPSGTCYSRESLISIGAFPLIQGTWEQDWYITLFAAFHKFEFEMMDRMLFIRESPSTATKDYKLSDRDMITYKMFERLISDITPLQKKILLKAFYSDFRTSTYSLSFCFKSLIPFKKRFVNHIKILFIHPGYMKLLLRRLKNFGI